MSAEISSDSDDAFDAMRAGCTEGLGVVFAHYRERLRKIVHFRLDYRLASRISDSDVLQESYIAAAKRLAQFSTQAEMPAFLWLRLIVNQQLIDLHRQHLQAERRDVRREVALPAGGCSPHTSMALAAQLVGHATAVSEVVARAEAIERLELTLQEMDDIDREVIALRHFEELSNIETAQVLNIDPPAASKRYVRAMSRLGKLMKENP